MPHPHLLRLLFPFVLALTLFPSCLNQSEKSGTYLSLRDFQTSAYDSVLVLLQKSSTDPDTLFKGPPSSEKLNRIPFPGYQGEKIVLTVEGYHAGHLLLRKQIFYDGTAAAADSTVLLISPAASIQIDRKGWPGQAKAGDSLAIPKVSVLPDKLEKKMVAWVSRNDHIALVKGSLIKALREGTVTLVAALLSDTTRKDSLFLQVLAKPVTAEPPYLQRVFPDTLQLAAGGSPGRLSLRFTPSQADIKINWESLDASVASVSDKGEVRGIKAGKTRIRAVTGPDSAQTSLAWVIVAPPPKGDSARFTPRDTLVLYAGGAWEEIGLRIYPFTANQDAVFKVPDTTIVRLDQLRIRGLQAGVTRLVGSSQTYPDLGDTLPIAVRAQSKVTRVTITTRALTLYLGGADSLLTAKALPDTAPQGIVWRLPSQDVVSMDKAGRVAAVAAGKVTATALSKADSTATDSAAITVKRDIPSLDLGQEDTTVGIGTTVAFTAAIQQEYGGISAFAWDLDDDRLWDDSARTIPTGLKYKFSEVGDFRVRFYVRDGEGNEAIGVKRISVLDGPLVVIVSPQNDFVTRIPNLQVAWSINGETQNKLMTETLKALGPNTVSRSGQDASGKTNIASITVYWDTLPPNQPIVSAVFASGALAPTWNWSGGGGGNGKFRSRLDDTALAGAAFDPVTSYTPASKLDDGLHTLYVQETDSAGNISPAGSRAIRVGAVASANTNADVKSLTLSSGAFSPPFTAAGISYSQSVDYPVEFVTATVTLAAPATSSAVINGVAIVSGEPSKPIPLWVGSNTITIKVTAESGDVKSYVIKVVRADRVILNPEVASVAAGYTHSFFLKKDGSLWATGINTSGQLGDGSVKQRYSPIQVMTGVAAAAAGWYHSLVLKTDGSLWVAGSNANGQLGDSGTTTQRSTPGRLMADVAKISAGMSYSLILKTDSTLWATGQNSSGQLGDSSTSQRTSPVRIMTGVVDISAGGQHSLILKADRTLWAAGANNYGQLGIGPKSLVVKPVQIMASVSRFSAGTNHTLIVKTDSTLWVTGRNDRGQLGDGSAVDRYVPVSIMAGVISVAAGSNHSLFLKGDGSLWSTGFNIYGQLGDGTIAQHLSPVKVMDDVASISAGVSYSLLVKKDGTAWAVGYNSEGQLGDGTSSYRLVWQQILP